MRKHVILPQGGRNKTAWEKFQKQKLTELNSIANMKCPEDTCSLGIDHLFGFIIFSLSGDMLKPLIFRELAKVALDLFGVMFNPIDFGEGTEVYCGFGSNTQQLPDRRPKGIDRLVQKTFCTFDTKADCVSAYKEKLSSGLRLPCEWDDKDETCSASTFEFCAIEKKKCGNKLTTFCTHRSGSQVECENSRAYLMRAGRTVPCFWNKDKKSCEPDSESVCSVEEVRCGPEGETVLGARELGIGPKGFFAIKDCAKLWIGDFTIKQLKAKTMVKTKMHQETVGDEAQLLAAYCAQHKVVIADGHAHAPCEWQLTGKKHECLASGKEICLPEKECGHHEHFVKSGKRPCENFLDQHYPKRNKKEHNKDEEESCNKRFYKDSTGFYYHCIYRSRTGLLGQIKFGCWGFPRESKPCHYQE